jgi:hypothetical protein
VYACPTCQPRVGGSAAAPADEEAATPGKKKKHKDDVCVCLKGMSIPAGVVPGEPAPAALTSLPSAMNVAQLKQCLKERVLTVSGKKAELIARLEKFEAKSSGLQQQRDNYASADASAPAKQPRLEGLSSAVSPTLHGMAGADMELMKGGRGAGVYKSAAQAAAEKGNESRAVEHIAVGTTDTFQLKLRTSERD